jgi:diguanylate cyclase (GGDEF)-like protein/PAS domain S-box-containing protein
VAFLGSVVGRIQEALPATVSLTPAAWSFRHRWIVRLVWLHAVGIGLAVAIKDPSPQHLLLDGTPVAVLAFGAGLQRLDHRARSIVAALGLLMSSALMVHLGEGSIEMHFHFFVMIGVISLYQDWRPFLAAIAFVAAHHGVIGVISPEQVYDHAAAQRAPILWAGIHALFVLAASAVSVGAWRIVEHTHQLSQQDLAESERRFRALIENATDVLTLIDGDGVILYDSPPCEAVLGYPHNGRVGTNGLDSVHPDDLATATDILAQAAANPNQTMRIEVRTRHRDGSWVWVDASITNLLDDPSVGGMVINFRDVTIRKELEAELAHQAFHDSLTSLANRALLLDRVEHALARTRRRGEVALLFLDLDDFKTVNDALGHEAGDEILRVIAGRLGEAVRPGDTASRLGGDEFAVLLDDLDDANAAYEIASRLLAVICTPVEIKGTYIAVNGSVGVVVAQPGDDAAALLRNADLAMYRAKAQGKGCLEVYEATMHAAAVERMALTAELRKAIDAEEFEPYYQPIVDLPTGRVVGVEALVRWNHPERGLLPPGAFIALAEETGLVVDIGRFVLRQACRDAARWHTELGDAAPVVSVNASPRQIQHGAFVEEVRRALRDSGLPASSLVIEITESALLDDTATATATLNAIDALGVRLSLDDFGTGYSSLSYLERFPVASLKIDKSFVDGLADRRESSPLVGVILTLASQLGLTVTAEGIEEPDQLAQLRELGCVQGQGYLFGRPMAVDAMHEVLRSSVPVV